MAGKLKEHCCSERNCFFFREFIPCCFGYYDHYGIDKVSATHYGYMRVRFMHLSYTLLLLVLSSSSSTSLLFFFSFLSSHSGHIFAEHIEHLSGMHYISRWKKRTRQRNSVNMMMRRVCVCVLWMLLHRRSVNYNTLASIVYVLFILCYRPVHCLTSPLRKYLHMQRKHFVYTFFTNNMQISSRIL